MFACKTVEKLLCQFHVLQLSLNFTLRPYDVLVELESYAMLTKLCLKKMAEQFFSGMTYSKIYLILRRGTHCIWLSLVLKPKAILML